ncbi:uncharacterized protein FIBRA_00891 [Fibroporia radiculosa]|uniref:SigF-like NTF2-like domain-containing protein n=1 Tax=Fibroporia radiculosa TaxID=599839 RepID=J4H0T0_9APHY|nr:uncharacterized protein FIBRA_00891 [Fibroporia radiculosa]CCL98884.1 predicted protein [Fibroporia radiculosa]
MEDPAHELEAVVLTLTTAVNAEIQKAAILRYFAPDASFRHPCCTVPPSSTPSSHPTSPTYPPFSRLLAPFSTPAAADSRETILSIYQWYRVLSPRLIVHVKNVCWDPAREEAWVEVVQAFHIWTSPLPAAEARLFTHLQLRRMPSPPPAQEGDSDALSSDPRPLFVIASQEDFYHPEDLMALLVPPLVPLVHILLLLGTWASLLGAWFFGSVLGWWAVKSGEGGRGVTLDPAGEALPPQNVDELNTLANGDKAYQDSRASEEEEERVDRKKRD